ncbi:MAG TPA: hypothetical protein VF444_16120 [Pseudonocardiaceae bacterium]
MSDRLWAVAVKPPQHLGADRREAVSLSAGSSNELPDGPSKILGQSLLGIHAQEEYSMAV